MFCLYHYGHIFYIHHLLKVYCYLHGQTFLHLRAFTVEAISMLYTDAGFKITKVVNKMLEMKFADGTAFLNHHFVKLGWLGSWMQLFPEAEHRAIFSALEDELNQYAVAMNGLQLEVPMLYMEGEA